MIDLQQVQCIRTVRGSVFGASDTGAVLEIVKFVDGGKLCTVRSRTSHLPTVRWNELGKPRSGSGRVLASIAVLPSLI